MFQLYYTLNTNLQTTDLKKAEKEEILKVIKTMDDSSKKALFLLMYEHLKINEKNSDPYQLPYGGVKKENCLEFDIGKMPIKLRRILYKFVKIVQKNENS